MHNKHLLVDEVHGIYVPQYFVENYDTESWGIDPEDARVLLEGPEHPDYWETWDIVLRHARYTDEQDVTWYLYQGSDLWAIPEDYEDPDFFA